VTGSLLRLRRLRVKRSRWLSEVMLRSGRHAWKIGLSCRLKGRRSLKDRVRVGKLDWRIDFERKLVARMVVSVSK